jgi:hypothetical protein
MKTICATAVSISLLLLMVFACSPVLAQQNHWDVRIQDTVRIGKVNVSTFPWPDSIGVPIYIWADDTLGGFSLALKSSDSRLQPISYSNTGSVFHTGGSIWTDAVIDTPKNTIGFAWYNEQAKWQPNPRGLLGTVYFRIDPTIPTGTIVNVDSAFIAPAVYCELTTVVSGFVHAIRPAPMVDQNSGNIKFAASYLCGDANGDGSVDISDAVYLIAYIFAGGSAPNPLLAGDANCDSAVDISDVVYLIAYIFSGGPAPCVDC